MPQAWLKSPAENAGLPFGRRIRSLAAAWSAWEGRAAAGHEFTLARRLKGIILSGWDRVNHCPIARLAQVKNPEAPADHRAYWGTGRRLVRYSAASSRRSVRPARRTLGPGDNTWGAFPPGVREHGRTLLLPASSAQWCGRPRSAYTGKTAAFAKFQRSLDGRAPWAREYARTKLGRRSDGLDMAARPPPK